jgi:pentatricopeptide repeat protein
MSACQRAGEWERVLGVIGMMKNAGLPADLPAFSAVMAACIRAKAWIQVPEVIALMKVGGRTSLCVLE